MIEHPAIAIADLWGSPDAKARDSLASLRLAHIAPTLTGATNMQFDPATEAVASIARLSTQETAPPVQPDMLLGADFLRSHRVLMAISHRKLYFTYAGGRVFGNLGEQSGAVPLSAVTPPLALLSGNGNEARK